MPLADLGHVKLAYTLTGPQDGLPVVFAHGLGLRQDMWAPVLPYLPSTWRVLTYDLRGHGGSDVPPAPYAMGALVRDAEALITKLALGPCVFVGLSLGGMIAQGLAVKRPDLLRAMVLSNTAARIATPEIWAARAATAREGGLDALVAPTLERWFTKAFRESPDAAPWAEMFRTAAREGWLGGAAAIAGTDFYTTTAALTLPTLGIAGDRDGSTPADLVRETVELIQDAEFALIRRAGHLPHVEHPETYADLLKDFITRRVPL